MVTLRVFRAGETCSDQREFSLYSAYYTLQVVKSLQLWGQPRDNGSTAFQRGISLKDFALLCNGVKGKRTFTSTFPLWILRFPNDMLEFSFTSSRYQIHVELFRPLNSILFFWMKSSWTMTLSVGDLNFGHMKSFLRSFDHFYRTEKKSITRNTPHQQHFHHFIQFVSKSKIELAIECYTGVGFESITCIWINICVRVFSLQWKN